MGARQGEAVGRSGRSLTRVAPVLALAAVVSLATYLALPRLLDRDIAFYDEGVYVATAKGLAAGSGYRNPSLPDAPPQAKYPPLFPLALSFVWRLAPQFPANLIAMKALVFLAGMGLLTLTFQRAQVRRGSLEAVAVVAVLAASPMVLLFASLVTSDIPFAFLSLLAIDAYERGLSRPRAFATALVAAALAVLTRTVGAILFVAMVVDLLRRRDVGRAVVCAVVGTLAVVPWLVWAHWASASYAAYPPSVRGNYVGYAAAISSGTWLGHAPAILGVNLAYLMYMWNGAVTPWAPIKLGSVLILAVLALFLLANRRRSSGVGGMYCASYLLCILIVPYPDTGRYAIALSPFLVGLFVAGARGAIEKGLPTRVSRIAGVALTVALTFAALAVNVRLDSRAASRRDAALWTEYHRMIDWIQENLPAEAVVVGDFDPSYYLLTGRKAIRLSVNDNFGIYYASEVAREFPHARDLVDHFQRMGACYVIRDPMIGGWEDVFFGNLIGALGAASPTPLRAVYRSRDGRFIVYQWAGCGVTPPT